MSGEPILEKAEQLRREKQKYNDLELSLSFKRERHRKSLISKKIKLGNLFFEAGLEDESPETLKEILADAKRNLDQSSDGDCS